MPRKNNYPGLPTKPKITIKRKRRGILLAKEVSDVDVRVRPIYLKSRIKMVVVSRIGCVLSVGIRLVKMVGNDIGYWEDNFSEVDCCSGGLIALLLSVCVCFFTCYISVNVRVGYWRVSFGRRESGLRSGVSLRIAILVSGEIFISHWFLHKSRGGAGWVEFDFALVFPSFPSSPLSSFAIVFCFPVFYFLL